ncbi:HAMP domain-containing protein [Fertoebacter nigrum]|uniref:histidine kinase n=2 Tax=Fertoeibacter niger TaxID=2656921 RepID=A0A8X8KLY1_9RHOB|nr:HAMP domain-containing protein [Fertoeibacter niger]
MSFAGWWRRMTDRIGFRLAFLLAVALLPLGVVSVVQSAAVLDEARARSEAALTGETMRAAETAVRPIQRARGAAMSLAAAVEPLIGDAAACSAVMRRVADASEIYSLVGFIPLDGQMVCSSVGAFDFSNNAMLAGIIEAAEPTIILNPSGPVSKVAVVGVLHPVFAADGRLLGLVSISLPHSSLVARDAEETGPTPPVLMTFGADGAVVTSSAGLEAVAGLLPANRSLKALAGPDDLAFTAPTVDGPERVFSVVPILAGTIYALGSWPAESNAWLVEAVPAAILPALMWLACLLVAWLATERLVTRHIRGLQAAITTFAGGNRIVGRIEIEGAPLELRQLAGAFDKMTDTILHDEAELEDMVHQKEVLLREVHHRVKNNLQLIASIMNMQMRQARSPEAKVLMKGLQDRVMSLATIHRELYQTSGLTDIRADELLSDIVRQVVKMATGPGRQFAVTTSIGDLRLTPDQAVPLSLLLTEALTNAMKYAGSPDASPPRLDVALHRVGGTGAVLQVTNTLGPKPVAQDGLEVSTGLGAQLLMAFAQQVGGQVDTEEVGSTYHLRVTFEVRPLVEAEARNRAERPE